MTEINMSPVEATVRNTLADEPEVKDTDLICTTCGHVTSDQDAYRYSCWTCQDYKGWMTIAMAKKYGYYEEVI